MDNKIQTIVVDVGSQWIRIGEGHWQLPTYRIPTYPDIYRNVALMNWELLERQLQDIFSGYFNFEPLETRILFITSASPSERYLKALPEMLFYGLGFRAYTAIPRVILAANQYQTNNAVIWEFGEHYSVYSVILEGCVSPHITKVSPITGKVLTDYLIEEIKPLMEKNTEYPKSIWRRVKHQKCFVSADLPREIMLEKSYRVTFPKKEVVSLGKHAYELYESLFNPEILDYDFPSVTKIIRELVQDSPIDYRRRLYQNIILIGDEAKVKGLKNRLQKELKELVPSSVDVVVKDEIDPTTIGWVGGAAISQLEYPEIWTENPDLLYEEQDKN